MLPLFGALSTFVSLDLDVVQEYLPPLTQQLEEENEATSGRSLLSCYFSQKNSLQNSRDCCENLEYCYVTRNKNYLLACEVLIHYLRSVPGYVNVPAVTISESVAKNLSKIIYINLMFV